MNNKPWVLINTETSGRWFDEPAKNGQPQEVSQDYYLYSYQRRLHKGYSLFSYIKI